jgi:hypothetical protein
VNHVLNVVAVGYMLWTGWRHDRTPLWLLSRTLDRRVCNLLFRKKGGTCKRCGKPANEVCSVCGVPLCPRHIPLRMDFSVKCTGCCASGK